MQLIREKLTGSLSQEAEAALVGALRSQFQPVVSDARREWRRIMELPGGEEPSGGDLFLTPAGELLFFRVTPSREAVEAGAVVSSNGGRATWDTFRTRVGEAVGSSAWVSRPLVSPGFRMLQEEAEQLQVSERERGAAGALVPRAVRRLLQTIAGSPGIALQQAAEGRPLVEVGAEVQDLDELGLLGREFEVFCRKTDQKISRVASLSALDEAAQRGFKCFHCGRSISEEQIIQLLTVTPEGMRLARPNVWLALLLGTTLLEKGVDPSRILWRSELDHEIVEVFADFEGSLLMFALQENGLSADGAFRFLGRTRFFEPDRGFLISPVPVREDARRVLHGQGPRLQIVDDLAALAGCIESALDEASRGVVRRVLADFEPLTRVCVGRLVGDYFLGQPEDHPLPVAQDAPAPAPGLAPEAAAQPAPPQDAPEFLPGGDELAILEEEPQFLPETSLETVGEEVAPEHEPEEEHPLEEALPELPIEEAPEAELLLEEPLFEQPIPSMIGDFAQEIIPGAVSLVGEDQEEVLAGRVSRILATLLESGPTGRMTELRDLVHDVSDLEECSAMIADSDGLVFLGELDTVDEPDLVAAVHVDLVDSVRRGLAEADLGELEGVLLDGGQSRLQLYPSVEGLNLLVHSGRPPAEHEEETGPSLPGEMALREAILKKALEGMGRLDGVRGNLVSQREGLPIDFMLPDESQADILAAVMTQVLVECDRLLERVGMAPLRQALLRTPEAWYSIVPLGGEGLLITLLEPGTSRDVWLSRLPREASMVASVLH